MAPRIISYNGLALTTRQWAEMTGLSAGLIRLRLHRGWTVRDALTTEYGCKRREERKKVCDRDCFNCRYGDCIDNTPWVSKEETAMARCGMQSESAASLSVFDRPHELMIEGNKYWR